MATSDIGWRALFPGKDQPQLYSHLPYNEDGFEVLTSSQEFLTDISVLDGQQMHMLAANNQVALEQAQNEFMALERQFNRIKHKDMINGPIAKDPRKLPDHDVCEEMKEAGLYGFKYDPKRALPTTALGIPVLNPKDVSEMEKHDVRLAQDPWTQGGFVPGKRQADIIRAKAKDPHNPDGWTPILKNGRHLIPKMYVDTDANFNERYGRYGAPATKSQTMQSVLLSNTRRATGDDSVNGTRRGTPVLVNKPLRNTRFNGSKVPQTRDVSEAPSVVVSRASTPKRKRGDTPMQSIETGSPAAKKAKNTTTALATATNAAAPPRKRHNQYTKARERAEQEAAAAAAAAAALAKENGLPSPQKSSPPEQPIVAEKAKADTIEKDVTGDGAWRLMTPLEKFEFTHWKPKDLITAIEEDPSWTAGPFDFYDPALPSKIQKKLTNIQTRVHRAQNPIRSWAAYRTWISWTFEGNDKRGPRKRKSGPNSAAVSSEEPESEAEPEPEPETEPASDPVGDDTYDDLDGEGGATSPVPAKGSRGEKIVDYAETEDELAAPKRPRRRTRK